MHSRPVVGLGLVLVLLSALTFATSPIFARSLIDAGWSPEAAVIARVSVGALVLAVPSAIALRGRWSVLRRNLAAIGLFGVLGVATAQVCFFYAIRYLPIGVALLVEHLAVVPVVLWMWLAYGQRPRRLTVAGAVVAVLGLVFVLDLTGATRMDPVGVLWALAAAVGLAGYFVLSERIDGELPAVALATGGMAVAAVVLGLLGAIGLVPLNVNFGEVSFLGQPTSWLVPVAGLSLVTAVVSYLTGIAGTRILGARLASFVGLIEVVFAVLIAWLVLAELPTLVQLFGGVLIVGGVVLVRLDELRGVPTVGGVDLPSPEKATTRSGP
ncbi:EamA family transporter [Micromonospora sp. NPDC000207]|uniref:EamA family transporter n=1 Tax=Micromonospora sp. NPDC000207 TaxID=3154246 RepID=UPI00332F1156